MAEAKLVQTEAGLAPQGDGWFVLNARDAIWRERDGFGARCGFETDGRLAQQLGVEPQHFTQLGINIAVIEPGDKSTLYHGESAQEDFLVLQGEALAIVEEEERRVKAWDFVHCPPHTRHVFVNDTDAPCVLLMVGARFEEGSILYPTSDVAGRYGATAEAETDDPHVAYAPYPHWRAISERPEL